MKVSNWGNYPVVDATLRGMNPYDNPARSLDSSRPIIARGLGRSYGDSSLSENIVSMLPLNRLLSFDQETGTITSESGVSLGELLEFIVPRGWFLPVTPGTKFVTLGGAVASDVHGKNHHIEGSFTDHVVSLDMLLPSGETVTCSPIDGIGLFRATCGGMGLTGIILRVTLRLKRIETAYIRQNTLVARDLEAMLALFDAPDVRKATYSVAWIDTLKGGRATGRGIVFTGEHASSDELRTGKLTDGPLSLPRKKMRDVPFFFPSMTLNGITARAFNAFYFKMQQRRQGESTVHYDPFYYPLDSIGSWNRIYGKRGFLQYQCVLPMEAGVIGLRRLLDEIRGGGFASFLAVLKQLGKGNENLISFPMAGYTLALDFPRVSGLIEYFEKLDRLVLDMGGRLYLAKDARMSESTFKNGYNNAMKFMAVKNELDPDGVFASLQSRRLGIHHA